MAWKTLFSMVVCVVMVLSGFAVAQDDSACGAGEKCCPASCEPVCCPSSGYWLKTEVLFLNRDADYSHDYDIGDLGGDVVLKGSDADLDWGTGIRITAGLGQWRDWDIEASYLGIFDWNGSDSVSDIVGENLDPADEIIGFFGGATTFTASAKFKIDYDSEFHSVELNAFQDLACMDNTEFMWGLRYGNLSEHFEFITYDSIPAGPADIGRFKARTRNELLGGQIGLRHTMKLNDKWEVQAFGKAGLYLNFAEMSNNLNDPQGAIYRRYSDSKDDSAAIYELGVNATYKHNECLSFGGGYNFMWMSGLALANEQFSEDIRTDGRLFAHGPSVFMVMRW